MLLMYKCCKLRQKLHLNKNYALFLLVDVKKSCSRAFSSSIQLFLPIHDNIFHPIVAGKRAKRDNQEPSLAVLQPQLLGTTHLKCSVYNKKVQKHRLNSTHVKVLILLKYNNDIIHSACFYLLLFELYFILIRVFYAVVY